MRVAPSLSANSIGSFIKRRGSFKASGGHAEGRPAGELDAQPPECDASSQCSSGCDSAQARLEGVAFGAAAAGSQCPVEARMLCLHRAVVEEWDSRQVALWLDRMELDGLKGCFEGVTGRDLVSPKFQCPPEAKVGFRKRFGKIHGELLRSSRDPFDAAAFQSPAEQIVALKETVVKLSLALDVLGFSQQIGSTFF